MERKIKSYSKGSVLRADRKDYCAILSPRSSRTGPSTAVPSGKKSIANKMYSVLHLDADKNRTA